MDISESYQVAFDVYYSKDFAIVGYVLFKDEYSSIPYKTGQVQCFDIQPYVPGQFYKRELPCLLTAMAQIDERISLIYIDANVWLSRNKKGLGKYLYDSLEPKTPVIGISKSFYSDETDVIVPVRRLSSIKPLYISSIGIDLNLACEKVKQMNGKYRLPEMIKLADKESRKKC